MLWSSLALFVSGEKKERRHCACAVADDLSIHSCTSAVGKKVTLELAIYYFDFKWGDEVEIDRVWLGPFNYSVFRFSVGSLPFGRRYKCCT